MAADDNHCNGLNTRAADRAERACVVEGMLSSIGDFIYAFDRDGRFVYVNKALLDLWGQTFEEAVGKNFFDLKYPDDLAAKLQQQIQQVFDTRQSLSDETPYENAETGAGGVFEYIFSPVFGVDGAVEYVAGTTRDITRQHNAFIALQGSEENFRALAEKLRESEERATNIVESITDGLITVDHDWCITYINPRGLEIVQPLQKSASLVGKLLWDEFPDTRGTIFENSYRRSVQEQVAISFEGFYAPLNIWVDVRAYPARDGLSIYFLDITERKCAEAQLRESELRFRQLADTMPQMVWVTRPDGFHEYYNHRWYEFTGVPEGSTDGDGWNGMFHPDDQDKAWERWRHSLASGETYETEYRLRHHSGEYRWVLGRAMPIRNAYGEIERWFGTCTEIDAMKRLTEERAQLLESERAARSDAERESRLKDDFLATLSHELRTPLGAILGWTYVLRSGKSAGMDLSKGLAVIERNARAQAQLIDDLLDMSRITSGKLRLDVQKLQAEAFVDAAIETVMPAADARGIRIERVFTPVPGQVSGDADRLQQVIWNLLSNAIKFTPPGGHVRVNLAQLDSTIEVAIADSGQGITAEFLPHVFDRFRQADSSETRPHAGLGLGLAIVKQLVELHGGTVRVTSEGHNRGTTFTVVLPLHGVHSPARAGESIRLRESGMAPAEFETVSLAGLNILVVEDEPDVREIIKRVLENSDAQVSVAATAREALSMIELQHPDVLISDIGMAEVSGYEFLAQVRALEARQEKARNDGDVSDSQQTDASAARSIPAIALTAFARPEDRTRALLAGYIAHLTKPTDPAELVATIAAVARSTSAWSPQQAAE